MPGVTEPHLGAYHPCLPDQPGYSDAIRCIHAGRAGQSHHRDDRRRATAAGGRRHQSRLHGSRQRRGGRCAAPPPRRRGAPAAPAEDVHAPVPGARGAPLAAPANAGAAQGDLPRRAQHLSVEDRAGQSGRAVRWPARSACGRLCAGHVGARAAPAHGPAHGRRARRRSRRRAGAAVAPDQHRRRPCDRQPQCAYRVAVVDARDDGAADHHPCAGPGCARPGVRQERTRRARRPRCTACWPRRHLRA